MSRDRGAVTGDDVVRRARALAIVGACERAAGAHRVALPRRFDVAGDAAWRVGADLSALPTEARPDTTAHPGAHRIRAAATATVVRFGKFDRDESLRARAYLDGERPTTLKIQTDRDRRRGGVAREIRARREVDRLVPGLAPTLLASGEVPKRQVAWLLEEVVHGRHPARPKDVDRHADAVIGAVTALYCASGFSTERLSNVIDAATSHRFESTVAVEPALERYVPHVRELLGRDGEVDIAFGHGDLVGSNVLVCDDGTIQLVDWEFARRRPVVDDLGTVLAQARNKPRALAVVERHLGGHVGVVSSTYTLRDQLVLAQVRKLSWYEHRRNRAAQAGRLGALERDMARRVEVLDALLG